MKHTRLALLLVATIALPASVAIAYQPPTMLTTSAYAAQGNVIASPDPAWGIPLIAKLDSQAARVLIDERLGPVPFSTALAGERTNIDGALARFCSGSILSMTAPPALGFAREDLAATDGNPLYGIGAT